MAHPRSRHVRLPILLAVSICWSAGVVPRRAQAQQTDRGQEPVGSAFVYAGADGVHSIIGSEEGAFRIRNGRVEPLGDAGAAATWKGRPASDFFNALRSLR